METSKDYAPATMHIATRAGMEAEPRKGRRVEPLIEIERFDHSVQDVSDLIAAENFHSCD